MLSLMRWRPNGCVYIEAGQESLIPGSMARPGIHHHDTSPSVTDFNLYKIHSLSKGDELWIPG